MGKMEVRCTMLRLRVSNGLAVRAQKRCLSGSTQKKCHGRPPPYRHLHPKKEKKKGAEALNPKKLRWKVWCQGALGPGDGQGRGGVGAGWH